MPVPSEQQPRDPPVVRPGMVGDLLAKLLTAAEGRATFDAPAADAIGRKAVRLCRGAAPNPILAFPAPLALNGPQQYARFARPFRNIRELAVLSVPGFVGEERLPASLEVAVQDQAVAIRRAADGRAAVLMGYSTGGTLAYGMAAHMERSGLPVAGVVLLDAYPSRVDTPITGQLEALVMKLFNSPEWRGYLNDTRLTAMGWYTHLVRGWELEPIAAPTLLVRPTEPMPGVPADDDWRAVWPFDHDVVEVRGDHYTMLEAHADTTGEAVESWLAANLARAGG